MSDHILTPIESPFRVAFDGSFRMADQSSAPPEDLRGQKKKHRAALDDAIDELSDLQRAMYAHDRWSLLLVFQAMDAAGKDGTIRKVMSGINPAGCQVWSFKKPSAEELDHDFLWRVSQRAPERGRIGIFNRSHYEEVLVVKVHPEYLGGQRLPGSPTPEQIFSERYESIRNYEKHLASTGTVILKFFLNVGRDEPESRWKFNPGDVVERGYWDDYMSAYEAALNETSRPWAPWFAIPADEKPFTRRTVAEIVTATLKRMNPQYPAVSAEDEAEMLRLRAQLEND